MYGAVRGAHAYQQTQVQSRTPLELVVMLYDGALGFMTAARDAIGRRDIPARRTALSKAMAIIAELQSTLNMDQGGDIARSLDELYRWANVRLLEAAAHNDPAAIDEVAHVIGTLRDGWSGLAAGHQGKVA
jgi:flagellar secretion chaperone FliS